MTRRLLRLVCLGALASGAWGQDVAPEPVPRADPPAPGAVTPRAAEGGVAAEGAAEEHQPTRAEVYDGLVAPLALAPDILLTPVLGAVREPTTVVAAATKLKDHPKGEAPPAMPSGHLAVLAHVPEVLHLMAANPDWMANMNMAMSFHRKEVMDAIQRVRRGAVEVGNLSTDEVITVKDANGRVTIGLTDEAVLRVPRYEGSLVYHAPLEDGPPLVSYGPEITFPGYRSAAAGLRAVDAVARKAQASPSAGSGAAGSVSVGTVYPKPSGSLRAFSTGMFLSRNRQRHRGEPVRQISNTMLRGFLR
jgi:hypothetical protein